MSLTFFRVSYSITNLTFFRFILIPFIEIKYPKNSTSFLKNKYLLSLSISFTFYNILKPSSVVLATEFGWFGHCFTQP